MHYRTIVISDLHLGMPDSKYQQVLNFLEKNTCENLIMNGDIIDGRHLKFFKRPKKQGIFFQKIAEIATQGTQITYIAGNHDEFRQDFLPLTINNIALKQDMYYQSGKKKYYICHGHQFDKEKTIPGLQTVGFLGATFLYRLNRKYNSRRKKEHLKYLSIVKGAKRIAKVFMVGGPKKFEKAVENFIASKKADGLICGHLHKADIKKIGKYDYLNSGDRTESCTALVETTDNKRSLYEYK